MTRVIPFALGLCCLAALPATAQDAQQPDPVEQRLVAEANAQATQQQHFIEAVRGLVDARAKERTQITAEREYWKQYIAGLAERHKQEAVEVPK